MLWSPATLHGWSARPVDARLGRRSEGLRAGARTLTRSHGSHRHGEIPPATIVYGATTPRTTEPDGPRSNMVVSYAAVWVPSRTTMATTVAQPEPLPRSSSTRTFRSTRCPLAAIDLTRGSGSRSQIQGISTMPAD